MTNRTFTVRSAYMDAAKGVLWIVQLVAEDADIGEVLLESSTAHAAKHGQCVVQEFNRLLIIHRAKIGANCSAATNCQ